LDVDAGAVHPLVTGAVAGAAVVGIKEATFIRTRSDTRRIMLMRHDPITKSTRHPVPKHRRDRINPMTRAGL